MNIIKIIPNLNFEESRDRHISSILSRLIKKLPSDVYTFIGMATKDISVDLGIFIYEFEFKAINNVILENKTLYEIAKSTLIANKDSQVSVSYDDRFSLLTIRLIDPI